MSAPLETEVKIAISDPQTAYGRIQTLGFTVSVPRAFEANTIYDTVGKDLRLAEMLLRVRRFGDRSIVTWKGPHIPGPHKSRPELETTLGSAEIFERILTNLNFEAVFRYEKYRTEFSGGDEGHAVITLDETPVGSFLELEGSAAWIDQTAAQLGYSPSDYILLSYARLYMDYCERHGIRPSNMVFPA